jgi:hypothetical protein
MFSSFAMATTTMYHPHIFLDDELYVFCELPSDTAIMISDGTIFSIQDGGRRRESPIREVPTRA